MSPIYCPKCSLFSKPLLPLSKNKLDLSTGLFLISIVLHSNINYWSMTKNAVMSDAITQLLSHRQYLEKD